MRDSLFYFLFKFSNKKYFSHLYIKQLFSLDAKIFFLVSENLKKTPSKVAKNKLILFPYCPELPKWPKQKNLCSKMWLIDQMHIKLGIQQPIPKITNLTFFLSEKFDVC